MEILECVELLKKNNDFLIVSHKRPDGDTLGSCGALCNALRRNGKNAYIYKNTEITEKYLPYVEEYFAPENFEAKCIVAADVADSNMLALGFSGAVELCIDHHPSNTGYAKNLLLQGDKSACGQIILEVIKELNGNIDEKEATLLYIAISTDTGCFQYSNTNSDTFRSAAETLDAGANLHELNQRFFRRHSMARVVLEGMIYHEMTFHRDGKIAIATITLKMLEDAHAKENDCDDLANLSGRVEGTVVSVTLREVAKNKTKVSLRSDPTVNSSDICSVFGGGGHAMAAGCTLECSPEEAKVKILDAIDSYLK